MSQNAIVVLDTSIQIERIIGSSAQQINIEQHIADSPHKFATSQYVYMEFQRSILADYVRIYNAILQHHSWTEIAQKLRSSNLAYRPRAMGRCIQILTQAMETARLERENALDLLDSQIRFDLPLRFWRNVEPLDDPIACDLVATGVTKQSNRLFNVADTCRKESAACQLPQFLSQSHAQLHALAEFLSANSGKLKQPDRVQRLITAVQQDPQAALGQAACWPLGDVVILLQIPSDAKFWTIDKDFKVLAQALGIQLYQP